MTAVTGTLTGRRRPPIWVLLVAGSVITSLSLGVRATFGLFQDPVVETLQTGRADFALAIAIQNLMWGLSQPFAGAIADRFGTARVLAFGAVGYAAGLVLMSTASSPSSLWLSTGFIIGVANGAASFAVVLAAVGRMVSPERRSLALGVVSAMGSVGQFVLIPIVRWLIDEASWQTAALALTGTILVVAFFAPLLQGRSSDQARPDDGDLSHGEAEPRPLRSELRRAAHSRSYRLLNLAFLVCGFHVTFIATHLVSYAEDLGQSRGIAATSLALIGLFNIAGSLTAGALGTRHSKTRLLSFIYASRAVVITGFVLVPASATSIVIFGALIGLLWLATVPLTSAIVAAQFGTTHSGTLFGIVFLSHQIGAFIGAWMGGEVADRLGSYALAWWIAVGLGVMAAVVHLLIDEGPQPEPPPPVAVTPRLLGPAAGLLVAGGLTTASLAGPIRSAASATPEDQSAAASGDDTTVGLPLFCPLHPISLHD